MKVKIPIIDADYEQARDLAMRIARKRDEIDEERKNGKGKMIIA